MRIFSKFLVSDDDVVFQRSSMSYHERVAKEKKMKFLKKASRIDKRNHGKFR